MKTVNLLSLSHSSHVRSLWAGLLVGNNLTLEERLEEQAQGAHHTHYHKDPQEHTIHHHGHILPVFNHLQIYKNQKVVTEHVSPTCNNNSPSTGFFHIKPRVLQGGWMTEESLFNVFSVVAAMTLCSHSGAESGTGWMNGWDCITCFFLCIQTQMWNQFLDLTSFKCVLLPTVFSSSLTELEHTVFCNTLFLVFIHNHVSNMA